MLRYLSPLFVLAALISLPVAASELDVDLNDDAARLMFRWQAFADKIDLDASWLHHEDEGDVAALGLHVTGTANSGSPPLRGGVGGRLFWLDGDRDDGGALGLGGFLTYPVPANERFVLGASAYFAPDIFAFDGVGKYTEVTADVAFLLFEGASIYGGYRFSEAEFEDSPDAEFDSSLHIGLRLSF